MTKTQELKSARKRNKRLEREVAGIWEVLDEFRCAFENRGSDFDSPEWKRWAAASKKFWKLTRPQAADEGARKIQQRAICSSAGMKRDAVVYMAAYLIKVVKPLLNELHNLAPHLRFGTTSGLFPMLNRAIADFPGDLKEENT